MTDALLANLQSRASHRGLILARAEQLQDELHCTSEELAHALTALRDRRMVRILSPMPYLVVALSPGSWSGSASSHVQKEQQISSNLAPSQEEVPVSSAAAAATQQREVGGAGEGEALLAQVLAVLGPDADRREFATIIAGFDPVLIHRCLRRVQSTKTIRVSRAALFRSLLSKLSH